MLEQFERVAGKILEQLRQSKQSKAWNAQEISRKSGLSVQSIYSLANGDRGSQPEFRTIIALASGMGWKIEDFVSILIQPYKINKTLKAADKNSIRDTIVNNILDVLIDMPIDDSFKIKILKAAKSNETQQ